MLFSEVLSIHNAAKAEGSHADILGDAFLLKENPVYRRIKQRAIEIGARFVEASADYLLMPFNQLDRIVGDKNIPYVPSARLMAEVEAKRPGVFELEQMPMPESYHLHEAAHVIAEHCFAGAKLATKEERILKAVVCESFANTADALACGYAVNDLHRLLLKQNCYMPPTKAGAELMGRVRGALGEPFTARLVLLSYVYANFLREEVPADVIETLIREHAPAEAKRTKKLLKDCSAVGQIGQRLDPLFRVQTTQNYLHMLGFEGEIYDLLDFEFTALLPRKPFNTAMDSMVAVLDAPR